MKTPLGSFILGIPLYWGFNLHKKNQVWEGRQEWNDPHIGIVVIKPKKLFRLLINFANIYLCHLHRLNQGPSVQIYRFLQLNMAIYMGFGGFFFFLIVFFSGTQLQSDLTSRCHPQVKLKGREPAGLSLAHYWVWTQKLPIEGPRPQQGYTSEPSPVGSGFGGFHRDPRLKCGG
jgi:hypothetical protein